MSLLVLASHQLVGETDFEGMILSREQTKITNQERRKNVQLHIRFGHYPN